MLDNFVKIDLLSSLEPNLQYCFLQSFFMQCVQNFFTVPTIGDTSALVVSCMDLNAFVETLLTVVFAVPIGLLPFLVGVLVEILVCSIFDLTWVTLDHEKIVEIATNNE